MLQREQWVAYRVGARFAQRGDAMTLRRVTLLDGPRPYPNPPQLSGDAHVTTGIVIGAQAFLGLVGKSIMGRLVPGDQINTLTPAGVIRASWVVQAMPPNVATNPDGGALAGSDGTPILGTPAVYHPDTLAVRNAWPVVAVRGLGSPAPDPAHAIGAQVSFVYAADEPIFASTMSIAQQRSMGWTEVVSIGLTISAYGPNGPVNPPRIKDQVVLDTSIRNIITIGDVARRGVHLLYQVQAQ